MIIGVTGGVGAGKSTVLEILEKQFGAHIIMADDVAKELMEPDGASYRAIVQYFGEDILEDRKDPGTKESGEPPRPIDRKKLAALVFEDDEKLEVLNSLTHPKVKEEILSRFEVFRKEDPDALIVLEAALLIETGYRKLLDQLWVVLADREVRIERLMRDRGYSREKALSIMDNQLSDEEFRAHADVVIDNSKTIEETAEQVKAAIASARKGA